MPSPTGRREAPGEGRSWADPKSILPVFQHPDIDRVRRPADTSTVTDEAAVFRIKLYLKVRGVPSGRAKQCRLFGQSEFLHQHSKQAIHGIILSASRRDNESVAPK